MNGNTNVPFLMTIPTYEYEWFEIRDFGVGLTSEHAEQTIFSYLGSDKDSSDSFIGGWGLGAKSPFAYSSTYEVVLFKDGRTWIYNCWQDTSGLPQHAIFQEGFTDEPNGVLVRIPVKPTDIGIFADKCKNYIYNTNFNIKVKNVEKFNDINKHKELVSFSNNNYDFYLGDHEDYAGKLVVLYGGWLYNIDGLSNIESETKRILSTIAELTDGSIVIKVPVNGIDFDTSRESISATEQTLKYINGAIQAFLSHIQEEANRYNIDFTNTINVVLDKHKLNNTRINVGELFKIKEEFSSKFSELFEHIKFGLFMSYRGRLGLADNVQLLPVGNKLGNTLFSMSVSLERFDHVLEDGKKFSSKTGFSVLSHKSKRWYSYKLKISRAALESLNIDLFTPISSQIRFYWSASKVTNKRLSSEINGIYPEYVQQYVVHCGSQAEAELLYGKLGFTGINVSKFEDCFKLDPENVKKTKNGKVIRDLPKIILDMSSTRKFDYYGQDLYICFSESDNLLTKYRSHLSLNGNSLVVSGRTVVLVKVSPTFWKKFVNKVDNIVDLTEGRKLLNQGFSLGSIIKYKKLLEDSKLDRAIESVSSDSLNLIKLIPSMGIDVKLHYNSFDSYNNRRERSSLSVAISLMKPKYKLNKLKFNLNYDILESTIRYMLDNSSLKFLNWGMMNKTNIEEFKQVVKSITDSEVYNVK
jgi:hypothetical protein